jgi:hypothetical protein
MLKFKLFANDEFIADLAEIELDDLLEILDDEHPTLTPEEYQQIIRVHESI